MKRSSILIIVALLIVIVMVVVYANVQRHEATLPREMAHQDQARAEAALQEAQIARQLATDCQKKK